MKEEKQLVARTSQNALQQQKKPSSYWETAANTYTLAVRLFLTVLILFLVLFMILCSRAFTYNSIFGFFRELCSKFTENLPIENPQKIFFSHNMARTNIFQRR